MKHGVLKHYHPMMGRDMHIPWPPGAPAPAPAPAPYMTVFTLLGLAITSKYTNKVFTDSVGWTMLKGTDIGPMIPHMGTPSVTIIPEMVFSASKSYFGVATYKVGEADCIAVSLGFATNPNLNCGTPVPTPTGLVLALATHRVDMTWGDIFSGFAMMGVDWVIQKYLNKLGNAVGDKIAAKVQEKIYSKLVVAYTEEALSKPGDKVLAVLWAQVMAASDLEKVLTFTPMAKYASNIWGGVFSTLTGGPLGMDIGVVSPVTAFGTPAGAASDLAGSGGQAAGDYLDSPTVPTEPAEWTWL